MNTQYLDVVRLLVRVAPVIFAEPGFALKGGTAINLFVRDLPRLSVDLDLVFTDYQLDRASALTAISTAVGNMASRIRKLGLQVHVPVATEGDESKLFIRQDRTEVKVEINQVLRGTIHPVVLTRMVNAARDKLKTDLRLPVLASEELYAGKLVAALDRNHPRDWFDVMLLLKHEGITPGTLRCFVAYLAAHNRPPHEVLFGPSKSLAAAFDQEFLGMTSESVSLDELEEVQRNVRASLPLQLDNAQRSFLVSLVSNTPDWTLLCIPHLQDMPAVRWKVANLQNLERNNKTKFAQQAAELRDRFGRIERT
ncbi:MAG: nucleotidyl transferase AbiEii/AbiGii toxin family protein [Rhodoferax sp.]|nr:nucleotidyl transferase AbiEii/AbiGii toxin family protein [Rhodoferax sp.]